MTGGPVDLLRELVELESPTGDTAEIQARMQDELRAVGARVEARDGHLAAEVPGELPPLLLLGHVDTVWPRGTLARLPFRVEEGKAFGPGTYDMKAGLVVMLEAVRRADTRHALRVVVNADEEIGSIGSRPLLEEAAAGALAAFVLEGPTQPGGHLKTARKGIGRFRLTVRGRAAHAATPDAGASAIEELAHQILRLYALADGRGVTVNVGVVSGGTRENVIAANAEAIIDIRVPRLTDRDRLDAALTDLRPAVEGTELQLTGMWTRPPLERSAGSAALFAAAREHGRALGLELEERSADGGSDGNLVGHLAPVLDGLGAEGAGAHSDHEHVLVDSLEVRAELLARILREPGL
jgi:glutamate carboxypeptidase